MRHQAQGEDEQKSRAHVLHPLEGRPSFLKKKKQKTFMNWSSLSGNAEAEMINSFASFFKKEGLSFFLTRVPTP
jgi:hypothetical protein